MPRTVNFANLTRNRPPVPGGFGGAGAVHGVLATKGMDQGINSNTRTAIDFDGADRIDTDAYHDPSSSPHLVTVPAGLGGRYLGIGNYQWDNDLPSWELIEMTGDYAGAIERQDDSMFDPSLIHAAFLMERAEATSIQLRCQAAAWTGTKPVRALGTYLGAIKVDVLAKGARVARSSNQNLTNNAFTPISWQSADYDENGFWAAGNPSRLTFASKGFFLVGVAPRVTAGHPYACRFIRNGDTNDVVAYFSHFQRNGNLAPFVFAYENLNANDYLELECFKDATVSQWDQLAKVAVETIWTGDSDKSGLRRALVHLNADRASGGAGPIAWDAALRSAGIGWSAGDPTKLVIQEDGDYVMGSAVGLASASSFGINVSINGTPESAKSQVTPGSRDTGCALIDFQPLVAGDEIEIEISGSLTMRENSRFWMFKAETG